MHQPCSRPFTSMAINAQGEVGPCCAFQKGFAQFKDIPSLTTFWKSGDEFNKMRDSEKQGQWTLPGCEWCHSNPRPEVTHKMRGTLRPADLTTPRLTHLDLAFSNLCNLTCAMCDSHSSSSWHKHDSEFSSKNPWRSARPVWGISPEQMDNLSQSLEGIQTIEIKGGEPLLDKRVRAFLKKVIESKRAIEVSLITNFTMMDDELTSLLLQLPKLNLGISIDGVGSVYDWIRGYSFEDLEGKLKKYLPQFTNCNPLFHYVTSCYNATHTPTFWNWSEQLMTQLKIRIDVSFTLFAEHPAYVSPALTENVTKAIAGISSTQEYVADFPLYDRALKKEVFDSLENLKAFIAKESPLVTEELWQRHHLWHQQLVKMRGWDLKPAKNLNQEV